MQIAAKDFLRPGDVAFDVGANVGGLAIAFSRMVGERGAVHAFEANPRLIPALRADLRANGARNVIVVRAAVWSRSDATVPLYLDASYYASASTTASHEGWERLEVRTVSLDDYAAGTDRVPRLVKLDTEGAEHEALEGAAHLIELHSPVLVLEYTPPAQAADDAAEFLAARGYALFDKNLCRRVSRDTYLTEFERIPLSNIIAVPPSLLEESGYSTMRVDTLFVVEPAQASTSATFTLPGVGRYRIDVELEGDDDTIATLRLSRGNGEVLVHHEGRLSMLRHHSASTLVMETPAGDALHCDIRAHDEGAARLVRATVHRVVRN